MHHIKVAIKSNFFLLRICTDEIEHRLVEPDSVETDTVQQKSWILWYCLPSYTHALYGVLKSQWNSIFTS